MPQLDKTSVGLSVGASAIVTAIVDDTQLSDTLDGLVEENLPDTSAVQSDQPSQTEVQIRDEELIN